MNHQYHFDGDKDRGATDGSTRNDSSLPLNLPFSFHAGSSQGPPESSYLANIPHIPSHRIAIIRSTLVRCEYQRPPVRQSVRRKFPKRHWFHEASRSRIALQRASLHNSSADTSCRASSRYCRRHAPVCYPGLISRPRICNHSKSPFR